jgi:hypothetical protein
LEKVRRYFFWPIAKEERHFQNVCPQAPQHQVEDGQEVEAEHVNNSICQDLLD